MINFDGMKAEASRAGYPMLPEGPYIAEIRGINIEGSAPDQFLVIRVEIMEGEYKDYFTNRYKTESAGNSQYPAKYKGDFRLRIPHPQSSSQWPDTDKRRFNDAIYRIETSNPDYHWDGDETKLKGKAIGINMQAGTYNDKEYTRIGRLETVADIRQGLIKPMKPRKPSYSPDYQAAETTSAAAFTPAEDVEIPF